MNTKIIIGGLLVVGLGIGGYFFYRSRKKISSQKGVEPATEQSESKTESGKIAPMPSPNLQSETPPSASGLQIKLTPVVAGIGEPVQTKTACSEIKNLSGDKSYEYRKCDGIWFTRRKGTTGSWVSLAGNKTATSKLDLAFPKL